MPSQPRSARSARPSSTSTGDFCVGQPPPPPPGLDLPQRPRDQEGETWREFLRVTADETTLAARRMLDSARPFASNDPSHPAAGILSRQTAAGPSSSTALHVPRPSLDLSTASTGRKREHSSAAEHARRAAPATPSTPPRIAMARDFAGGPSGSGAQMTATSGTENNPIDLTASPPGGQPPAPRASSIRLPRWQPDDEVLSCTSCGNAFSWYYRKHHCRKCGKVVCANCSTHRITIPRQYVVNPPPEVRATGRPVSFIQPSIEQADVTSGAETVRVCNPCVPDPNYAPPFQQSQNQSLNRRSTTGSFAVRPTYPDQPPAYEERNPSAPSSHVHVAHQAPRAVPQQQWPGPAAPNRPMRAQSSASASAHATARQQPHRTSLHGASAPLAGGMPFPRHQNQNAAEIPDGERCPVCSKRLPALDARTGSDAAQTGHIERCIRRAERRFSGTHDGQSSTSVSGEARGGSSASLRHGYVGGPRAGLDASAQLPATAGSGAEAAPQAQDMLHFVATAQDVQNAEEKGGPPQECIICLEEFEVGQSLGRLDCLCKFHEGCLYAWWRTKGINECPTHKGAWRVGG